MRTIFFVLGCLSEYQGRLIVEGGDLVERLLGDEQDRVDVFRSHLVKLAEERGITTAIGEATEEGCTSFYSPELRELIDGCYEVDFSNSPFITLDPEPRRAEARISKKAFEGQGNEEKLSYLAGAYARHGQGNTFRLANARHKAEVVADLLRELGCRGVTLSLTNPGYAPSIHEVGFEPSEDVARWLQPYRRQG